MVGRIQWFFRVVSLQEMLSERVILKFRQDIRLILIIVISVEFILNQFLGLMQGVLAIGLIYRSFLMFLFFYSKIAIAFNFKLLSLLLHSFGKSRFH